MSFNPETVARHWGDQCLRGGQYVPVRDYDELLVLYRESQRELRQANGLKALLANGMPPTGNRAFDEILATHPIAAMIQRGWLGGVTGFEDLPLLEVAICHFYRVKTIEEAVNPPWPLQTRPVAPAQD